MKVILIAAATINGYIAKNQQELVDWTSSEDKKMFRELTQDCGVMIMGRTTFQTLPKPLPGRLHIVLTQSPEKYSNQTDVVEYTSASPEEILKSLSSRGFKKVAVIGGSQIFSLFLKNNLADELILTLEPLLFSPGIPLFAAASSHTLELLSNRLLNPNVICLHYRIKK